MPAKKKEIPSRRDEQLIPLTDVITSLDSIRAYRRRSSKNLDEKFRRLGGMGYSELGKVWWQVEDDVKRIVDMPLQIPRVPAMIQLNYAFRLSSRLFMILVVVAIAALFVRAWRSSLGALLGNNEWFLMAVVLGSIVTINGEIVVDFLIRRKVIKYEKATEEEFKENVDAVKKATQTVIGRLALEIERGRKNRGDFPFHLFFEDYDRIEIVDSRTPRSMFVFKRKYKVFTAVVK